MLLTVHASRLTAWSGVPVQAITHSPRVLITPRRHHHAPVLMGCESFNSPIAVHPSGGIPPFRRISVASVAAIGLYGNLGPMAYTMVQSVTSAKLEGVAQCAGHQRSQSSWVWSFRASVLDGT